MSVGATYVTIKLTKPGEWVDAGHCVRSPYPDMWYADDAGKGASSDVELAKQICRGCPSRTECLTWALGVDKANDWGVWGATTAKEREQLRKRRAAA